MKRAIDTKTLPRSLRRQRLANLVLGIVAAGSMVLVGQSVQACDYCDSGPVGCDSCSSSAKTTNPIFRTLDSVAGGIEALMGFDKCGSCGSGGCDDASCDDASCDDACDAAMIQELSIPYPQAHAPTPVPFPSYAPPQTVQPYVAPVQPHVIAPAPIIHSAPRTVAPIQTAPRAVAPVPLTDMRMSEPTIVSPESVPFEEMPSASERDQFQDYNTDIGNSNEPLPMPPAEVPMDRLPTQEPELPIAPTPDVAPNAPVPAPIPTPANPTPQTFPDDGGGLFDSLEGPATDSPFGDDEVRLPEPYRSIRPSNFRRPSSPSTPVQPSNYRRLNPPVQLHSPQTRGGYTNSRTQHVANQQRPAVQQYSAGHRVSVDQMRLAAERQNYTQKRRLTDQQVAAIEQAKAAQQRKISQQYAQTRTAQHNQVTNRGSVQRASAQHTTRRTLNAHASHQQVAAHQKQTLQRTAHQNTPHNNHATQNQTNHNHAASQLKRAPQPKATVPQVSRQITGQRHSNAGYSGYGHTTSSRRTAATYQQSSRRTTTTR